MSLKLMSVIPANPATHTTECEENADKIVRNLLNHVQRCQKRYGGRTELATELDDCVAALCLSLEALFSHGIRTKLRQETPAHHHSNKLKQVSDIVVGSFNLNNDNNRSFWHFIRRHLTKHEQERYELLKHVWTDSGRGRAWIRSSLNERSLERNFHTVLSNDQLLRVYYEDGALLRDEEKNSMLPNMAAGLGSILFAINIDKIELNNGCTLKVAKGSGNRIEPVIEAPVRDDNKAGRARARKHRVAKQIISFDEDEIYPSSSGSTESEYNHLEICSSSRGPHCRSRTDFHEDTKGMSSERIPCDALEDDCDTKTPKDKVSILLGGPLTPVGQTDVDKLTPVVMEEEEEEKSESSESPDISDDIIEVPADISAVLTAIEAKHKDEVAKLKSIVDNVTIENESLKVRLQKYVSAVKMLGQADVELSDTEELSQRSLDGRAEANVFERKLVQVAEMHAELMDFNVRLQQSLCQKDVLLEKLSGELEELRGPVSAAAGGGADHCNVHVWIPSAFLTGTGADVHHVYQIFLRAGTDEWNVYRRYAQFHVLHGDLKKLDPAVAALDFPPKKSIGRKDSSLVEDRRKRLERYLRRVLRHWPELARCNSRFLLEQHLPFFKDQRSDDDGNRRNTKRGALSSGTAGPGGDAGSSHAGLRF